MTPAMEAKITDHAWSVCALPHGHFLANAVAACSPTQSAIAVMNTQLTAQNITDILANKVNLVAYGYVKYKDAFGKPRESRFCFYFATYANDFRINLSAPKEYHQCD